MSDGSSGSRLPPPAFPPGSRKHPGSNNLGRAAPVDLGGTLISSDEPIPERDHSVEEVFISPDDPMSDWKDASVEAAIPSDDSSGAFIPPNDPNPSGDVVTADPGGLPRLETEGGVVTGMGMNDHVDAEDLASGGDPYVIDLVQKVGNLAEALRAKGEVGLRSSPDMDQFESTLRGYCVGYLAGRRAEDDLV